LFSKELFNACSDDKQKHFQLKTRSSHRMDRLGEELLNETVGHLNPLSVEVLQINFMRRILAFGILLTNRL